MTISVLNLGWDSAALVSHKISYQGREASIGAVSLDNFNKLFSDLGIHHQQEVNGKNGKITSIIQLIEMINRDEVEILPTSSLKKSLKDNEVNTTDLDQYDYLVFRKMIKGEKFVSRTRSPMFYFNWDSDVASIATRSPCGNAASSPYYNNFIELFDAVLVEAQKMLTGNDLKVAIFDRGLIKPYKFINGGKGNYSLVINYDNQISENQDFQNMIRIVKAAKLIMRKAKLREIRIGNEFQASQEEEDFLTNVEAKIAAIIAAKNVVKNREERELEISNLISNIEILRSTIENIENLQIQKLKVSFEKAKAHMSQLEIKKAAKKPSSKAASKNKIIEELMAEIAALKAQAAFNQG